MTYLKSSPLAASPKVKWIALALFIIALGFYGFGLGSPSQTYWDESIHMSDARKVLAEGVAQRYPPLGHEMLAASLLLFGNSPAGSRGLSVLCGAGGIALIFLIARRLTRNTAIGVFAALLLLFEPLYYLHSRLGMLDMFVTFFMILAFWIFLKIRERAPEDRPPYLYYMLGTALALGFSVKMIAVVLYPIFFADLMWSALKIKDGRRKKFRILHLLAAFSLPTFLVFWGAYAVLGHSLPEIGDHLTEYYRFMRHFHGEPQISSRWYEWLLVKMSIWYLKTPIDNTYSTAVVATGNHLIWWGAELAFVVLLFFRRWVHKEVYFLHLIIAAQFLFWEVKPTTHLYYMTPVVPFYVLLIGVFVQFMMERFPTKKKYLRFDAAVFLLCAFLVFGYYFPLINGRPIKTEKVEKFIFPGSDAPAADSRATQPQATELDNP